MLVLTRKIDEKIIIDDHIKVQVLSIRGNQIRIGVDAPSEVKIHREEIWKQIQANKNLGDSLL